MLTSTVRGRTFTYSHCIGQLANAGLGFRFPVDLALGSKESIYVLSRGDALNATSSRVTKCTMSEEFLLDFGGMGSQDGQFMEVTSLALDSDENVYVADEFLTRISVFDKGGRFLAEWGVPGSREGELGRPWGLAFDGEDNLWVVDSGNSRVQKFTRDGQFLSGWGRDGSGPGEFRMPWGITIDHQGLVYVADWYNGRVQMLTPDGEYLASFGADASGEGKLRCPSGVAVDAHGDVYVADWGTNRVVVYDPSGTYLTTFRGDAQKLSRWAQGRVDANPDYVRARNRVGTLEPEWRFHAPVALDVDDGGRIVIAEQQRFRLQVYAREEDYVEPQFNL